MLFDLIKRVFKRIFKSLISLYGPSVLTVLFALTQAWLFPQSPLWLIPMFLLCTIIFIKW